VLFSCLNDPVSDVAIAAAAPLGLQETTVDANTPMHVAAAPVLSAFGCLRVTPAERAGSHTFDRLLGGKSPAVGWARFFGRT
jgi:hypothetical protein